MGERGKGLSAGPNEGKGAKNSRAKADAPTIARSENDSSDAWRLEPHVCRVCHSRLVSRVTDGGVLYHCPNCGVEGVGDAAAVVCCCGMKVRRATQRATSGWVLVDAGIRCTLNPSPTPDFPSVYVASDA